MGRPTPADWRSPTPTRFPSTAARSRPARRRCRRRRVRRSSSVPRPTTARIALPRTTRRAPGRSRPRCPPRSTHRAGSRTSRRRWRRLPISTSGRVRPTVSAAWGTPSNVGGAPISSYEGRMCEGNCDETDPAWNSATVVSLGQHRQLAHPVSRRPVHLFVPGPRDQLDRSRTVGCFRAPHSVRESPASRRSPRHRPATSPSTWTGPAEVGAGIDHIALYRCLTTSGCSNTANWSDTGLTIVGNPQTADAQLRSGRVLHLQGGRDRIRRGRLEREFGGVGGERFHVARCTVGAHRHHSHHHDRRGRPRVDGAVDEWFVPGYRLPLPTVGQQRPVLVADLDGHDRHDLHRHGLWREQRMHLPGRGGHRGGYRLVLQHRDGRRRERAVGSAEPHRDAGHRARCGRPCLASPDRQRRAVRLGLLPGAVAGRWHHVAHDLHPRDVAVVLGLHVWPRRLVHLPRLGYQLGRHRRTIEHGDRLRHQPGCAAVADRDHFDRRMA